MASNYDNSNGSITEANLRTVTRKKSQRITTLRQQGFAGRELDSEAHPGFDTEALSLPLQELQLEDDAGSSLEHLLLEIENKLGEAECDPRSLGASFRELHTRCRQLEDRVNRAEHDLKAKDLLYVGLQTRYDDLQNQTIRDEATWKHSQMTLRNEYNEFANKAKRDIAALKNSRATLQTDYNGLADEVRRDTEASKPSRKKLKTKYSELKTQTNSEINTLKVYLREYQTKWNQLTEQHETLERQCSALVEEISGLRSKNLVDDESILQDNFKSLYFSIRSWCMRLTDNKLDPREPIWLTNPLLDDGFLYSCTTEASELHFLIAGLWTWLIKLVFDRLTDMECDDPDLWTEQKSSEAMRVLERGLVRQDAKSALEWRTLTVRLLAQCPSRTEVQCTEPIIKKIMDWVTTGPAFRKEQSFFIELAARLWKEVVEKAIKFSLDLRRQYKTVRVRSPVEQHLGFTPPEGPAALSKSAVGPKNRQRTSENGTIRIWTIPYLEKLEFSDPAGSDQDSVILVDGEYVESVVLRTRSVLNGGAT